MASQGPVCHKGIIKAQESHQDREILQMQSPSIDYLNNIPVKEINKKGSNLHRLKELIEELTWSEFQLELFFQLTPDLFCIASSNGYFKKLNNRWTPFLGWTKIELMSKPFKDFLHPDDVEKMEHVMGKMTTSDINHFKSRWITARGDYILIELSATRWIDGNFYAAGRVIPSPCDECSHSPILCEIRKDDYHDKGERILTADPAS